MLKISNFSTLLILFCAGAMLIFSKFSDISVHATRESTH